MNSTLKETLVISILYLVFRLSLYNFTTINQFIQITSSLLFVLGLIVISFIKYDDLSHEPSLSLNYFPAITKIFKQKNNKTLFTNGVTPTFQVPMITSAKLDHKESYDEINFQISLEYKLQITDTKLTSWDENLGKKILKELLQFTKISIADLPDRAVLTVTFEVLSTPAYLWKEAIIDIKEEAEQVNDLIKPFLSTIVPILAPILFQQENQVYEQTEPVEEVIVTTDPHEMKDSNINWSNLYNFIERESATEEV